MSDLPQGTSLDSRLHNSVSFLFFSLDSNTLGGTTQLEAVLCRHWVSARTFSDRASLRYDLDLPLADS